MAKRDYTEFLLTSFKARPVNFDALGHLMPVLQQERSIYFTVMKGEFDRFEKVLKKLQILALEKERKVIIYLIHNIFNKTWLMRCNLRFDDHANAVAYLEVDTYFMYAESFLKIIAKIENLVLVSGLPHNLLRYNKNLKTLHGPQDVWEFCRNQSFKYYESLVATNDFLIYMRNIQLNAIPENLVISLPLSCLKCIRGKTANVSDCYCGTVQQVRWDVIFGINLLLEFLLLRSIATNNPLDISYTKNKFAEQVILDGKTLQVQFWKAKVIPKMEKSARLRWFLWQNVFRGFIRSVDQRVSSKFMEYYPKIVSQMTGGSH